MNTDQLYKFVMEDTIAIDGSDKYLGANIYGLFCSMVQISGGSRVCQPLILKQKPIIWPGFVENCLKMKEIGPRRGSASLAVPLDPPMQIALQRHGENYFLRCLEEYICIIE